MRLKPDLQFVFLLNELVGRATVILEVLDNINEKHEGSYRPSNPPRDEDFTALVEKANSLIQLVVEVNYINASDSKPLPVPTKKWISSDGVREMQGLWPEIPEELRITLTESNVLFDDVALTWEIVHTMERLNYNYTVFDHVLDLQLWAWSRLKREVQSQSNEDTPTRRLVQDFNGLIRLTSPTYQDLGCDDDHLVFYISTVDLRSTSDPALIRGMCKVLWSFLYLGLQPTSFKIMTMRFDIRIQSQPAKPITVSVGEGNMLLQDVFEISTLIGDVLKKKSGVTITVPHGKTERGWVAGEFDMEEFLPRAEVEEVGIEDYQFALRFNLRAHATFDLIETMSRMKIEPETFHTVLIYLNAYWKRYLLGIEDGV